VVAVLFITTHNGGMPSTESRLDVSSCVSREEVDHALDCFFEGWVGGVVIWERWLVARQTCLNSYVLKSMNSYHLTPWCLL
jgi:hypothetical protein